MAFPWDDITWVLLDMDGTLLDKHFDDYFWETLVPQEYARRQGMDRVGVQHHNHLDGPRRLSGSD